MEKNLVTGGVMQLSNDTSPPYLVKNERSLVTIIVLRDHAISTMTETK